MDGKSARPAYQGAQILNFDGSPCPTWNGNIMAVAVWLMSLEKYYDKWGPKTLTRLLFPPLQLRQIAIVVDRNAPKAFVTWGLFDRTNMNEIHAGKRRLQASDWNQGDELWMMDVCCPFGQSMQVARAMQRNLRPYYRSQGADRVRYWRRDVTGQIQHQVETPDPLLHLSSQV